VPGPSTSPLEVIIVSSSLKFALVVGATALVSVVAGYLIAGYQLSRAMPIAFTSSYLTAALDADSDVQTLRAIHANDLAKATSILEARIDLDLLHLSVYNDAVSPEWRDALVYADLATVRKYRTEVPSSNDSPEVRAAIAKALALSPETRDRK
jgi:hypothetical protein